MVQLSGIHHVFALPSDTTVTVIDRLNTWLGEPMDTQEHLFHGGQIKGYKSRLRLLARLWKHAFDPS